MSSELEKRLNHEQAKPIHVVIIKNQTSFIADGYSRSKVYGLKVERREHHVINLREAWEKYKDLVGYNPYSTKEEKKEKFSFVAKNLRTIFNVKNEDMTSNVAELLGLSKTTVKRYLPEQYKDMKKKRKSMRPSWSHRKTKEVKIVTEKLSNLEMIDRLLNWLDEFREEAPAISEDEKNNLLALKNCIVKWVGE